MPAEPIRERASQPEDLDRLFLQRANAGDVDGLVALYEPNAVYEQLMAQRPHFDGNIRPAIRNGNLAITSTTRTGNATVEVARCQSDGTWLWVIDQPNVFES